MQTIDLSNDQNQSFTTTLEQDRYSIAIYLAGTVMCADISRNEVVLTQGQRITCGQFMIPFYWLQGQHGNFMLITKNNELADNTLFGITQILLYFTIAEMAEVFAGTL